MVINKLIQRNNILENSQDPGNLSIGLPQSKQIKGNVKHHAYV